MGELDNNKFRLTPESKKLDDGTKVFRIEALRDFNDVSAGSLGGFIEKEENLSFEEDDISWVYDDSVVYGESKVKWGSMVYKGGELKDTTILNNSKVSFDSKVDGCFLQDSNIQTSNLSNTKGFSTVFGLSDVKDSEVVMSNIGDSLIINSFVESTSTSYDTKIEDSHIEDKTLVEETLVGHDSRLELCDDDLAELEGDNLKL